MDCRRAAAASAGAVTVGKTFVGGSHARISVFFLIGTLLGVVLLASQGLAEMHSRSKHYSHRLRSGAGRSARAPDPSEPSPYFDNSTSRNVTTSAGKAVFLPCKVRHLGDRTVSWIRRRDLHVLTVGRFTYTSDQRFQAIHMDNSDLWMLQIQYPQKKDAGMYECQVSTLPKISRFIALNVIVSKANIAGGPTLYLNSGSTLNLTCEVMESPVPPDYVFWYHDARVINYDIQHGVSVQTEKSPRTQSRLLIANAQPHDSGNYSCVPSNAEPASIVVHVLNGEKPASLVTRVVSQERGEESESSTVAGVPRSTPRRNETSPELRWDVCEFFKKMGRFLTSSVGYFTT